jgi:glyoxylate reductase
MLTQPEGGAASADIERKGDLGEKKFRVFATCAIGPSIELLRQRGYEVEVYPGPDAPPREVLLEKVRSGIDGLITTLRDKIDAEIFEAGKGRLKGVA